MNFIQRYNEILQKVLKLDKEYDHRVVAPFLTISLLLKGSKVYPYGYAAPFNRYRNNWLYY